MPPSSRCRFPVPRAMQRIADETGAVIGGTLYGDLLSPVGGENDSYIKMLRHDEA
jgi:zinc/manganese transport system substrate-binding protein